MKKFALLTVSHAAAAAIGFALGIYVLPILYLSPEFADTREAFFKVKGHSVRLGLV